MWPLVQNGTHKSGFAPHDGSAEIHKSPWDSLSFFHILSAQRFAFRFFREGPMQGLSRNTPLCTRTLPARDESLVVSPQMRSAGGLLKKKRGCQEGDEQPREVVCVIEGNISKKWLAYCAQGCLLFFPLLPPGSDALLCKSNSDRHRERTGSAQSCERIPDHQPAVWSPPGYRCCCWCSLRARL